MSVRMVTAKAPVNIAVIKYWGKRNEDLILPINDSVSVTLSKNQMCATTTVSCSPSFENDKMWLNGIEQGMTNQRVIKCISQIKDRARKSNGDAAFLHWPVYIASENNFPTAAGLASSAAGYACLVYALGALYGVEGNLSDIARQGSGSACRSMYGGFVRWFMGNEDDGSDSVARQIASSKHWPELRVIVLVVSDHKKKASSTRGMKRTVETSDLVMHRANCVVPSRVRDITEAVMEKDFHRFSEITMKDSNQFHAVCLDTYPPVTYMDSTSHNIVQLVHAYNAFYGQNKVAYTFDAGPNACLYILEKDVNEFLKLVLFYFPFSSDREFPIRGIAMKRCHVPKELFQTISLEPKVNALQYIINTKVGSGPELVTDASFHLLNENGELR